MIRKLFIALAIVVFSGVAGAQNPVYLTKAEQGDAQCQFIVGSGYEFSTGGAVRDMDKALYWLNKSANQNYLPAITRMVQIYYFGIEEKNGIPKDYLVAFYWLQQGANLKDESCQMNLAFCYDYGNGVDVNKNIALYWYYQSKMNGNTLIDDNIKRLESEGYYASLTASAEPRPVETAPTTTSALAQGSGSGDGSTGKPSDFIEKAEQGDPEAQYNVGICYWEGSGVPVDSAMAAYWFKKAAAKGYGYAMYRLGVFYFNRAGSVRKGVPDRNGDWAVYWLKKYHDKVTDRDEKEKVYNFIDYLETVCHYSSYNVEHPRVAAKPKTVNRSKSKPGKK